MKLRRRAFFTTLLVAVPISFGLLLTFRAVMGTVVDNITTAFVQARFPELLNNVCTPSVAEQSYEIALPLGRGGPSTTPGHSIAAQTFFYDPNGRSPAPSAPLLPSALVQLKGAALTSSAMDVIRQGKNLRYVLVQLHPLGPCSQALVVAPVRRPIPPPLIFGPLLLLVIAVPLAVAPMVKRTRKLSDVLRDWGAEPGGRIKVDETPDELGELSRTFYETGEIVKAREQRSRRFVEDVSHDLASPLTVLQGYLSAMEQESNSPIIRHAMNETQYIVALLGSLRITFNVDSDEAILGPVDLGDVVRRVVVRHRAWAERLGVALEFSVPPEPVEIVGDVTFSEQALSNLVGNALVHGRTCRHVSIVLNTSGASFTLCVTDDGEGLSPEERERALIRGLRGEPSRALNPEGRGLGLSIVARVADAHAWKFTLHPNEPRGLLAQLTGASN